MSDLDMQSYAGEIADSAAESLPQVNSYLQETQAEEFPVHPELLEQPQESAPAPAAAPTPQELNFRALREEVDRIKAEKDQERREYQVQLDMLRANQSQQPSEQPKKMFGEMRDDDIPNVAEIRRAWEERETAYQGRIEELEVARMYPDYAEVIEKHTVPLVKDKPHLAEGLRGATNKALFAYELGKMAQKLQTPAPVSPEPSQIAQRIVENARKPGLLGQTGGQSTLSQADYYATMSDKEFMAFAQKNLDGI